MESDTLLMTQMDETLHGWDTSDDTDGWDTSGDTDGWDTSDDTDAWDTSDDTDRWDTSDDKMDGTLQMIQVDGKKQVRASSLQWMDGLNNKEHIKNIKKRGGGG